MWYILNDDHTIRKCADANEWMCSPSRRRVALDYIGVYRVSTVFLGIDHGHGDDYGPILFETMVFKGDSSEDLFCKRYGTWDDAFESHGNVVECISNSINSPDGKVRFEK